MGKFADFYVVPQTEAGLAARSMGWSDRWPHYDIKRVDVFQLATLYDLLRGVAGEDTWKQFGQRVEVGQRVEADLTDEACGEGGEEDFDGPLFFVATFPADFVTRLAGLGESDRRSLAERWQTHPEFFWSSKPGVATKVVAELCRLAAVAVERQEVLVLAESGE